MNDTPKQARSYYKTGPRVPASPVQSKAFERWFPWGSELRPWPGELEYLGQVSNRMRGTSRDDH